MLDYHDLDDADDIASRPPVNVTVTGRKAATDNARKWSPWSIAANSCAQIERPDGTAIVAIGGGLPGVGGGDATGKVYQLSDTQFSDDGSAIPSYYTTHYFPERAVEQSLTARRASQTFQLSNDVRRRGRELVAHQFHGFLERLAGAAAFAAQLAFAQGSRTAH